MDGQILRRLKQIAKFVVFENLQVSLMVFQSLFYFAFHKHVNSKVQKLPYNWVFRYHQSELQSQATNRETQKHTKRIEIHQSQIANHDLLNPLK